jgi:hypothetical protein
MIHSDQSHNATTGYSERLNHPGNDLQGRFLGERKSGDINHLG